MLRAQSPAAALLLALAVALPAAAQQTTPGATIIDRANQNAPGTALPPAEPGAAPAVPGADSDAGTQRIAEPRRLPFRAAFSLDQHFSATSNVFLAADDETGALVSTSTVALDLSSLPVVVREGRLTFSAGLLWQRYLHGIATSDPAIEELDFDSYSLPVFASYRFGRGWEATAGHTIGALYSIKGSPSHELLYRSHTTSLALRRIVGLREGLALALGGGISYANTDASLHEVPSVPPVDLRYRTDRNDRVDASLSAALHAFSGPWTFSPALRVSHAHYLHWQEGGFNAQDRDDLSAGLSLTLAYAFADWGDARLSATYDRRSSAGGIADYDYASASAGLGLGLELRF